SHDWASRWDAGPPPQWADAVERVVMASLSMPLELADDHAVREYNAWFEQHHLEPLRSVWPERYRAVVEQIRSYITLSAEDNHEENDTRKTRPPSKTARRGRAKAKVEAKAKANRPSAKADRKRNS